MSDFMVSGHAFYCAWGAHYIIFIYLITLLLVYVFLFILLRIPGFMTDVQAYDDLCPCLNANQFLQHLLNCGVCLSVKCALQLYHNSSTFSTVGGL